MGIHHSTCFYTRISNSIFFFIIILFLPSCQPANSSSTPKPSIDSIPKTLPPKVALPTSPNFSFSGTNLPATTSEGVGTWIRGLPDSLQQDLHERKLLLLVTYRSPDIVWGGNGEKHQAIYQLHSKLVELLHYRLGMPQGVPTTMMALSIEPTKLNQRDYFVLSLVALPEEVYLSSFGVFESL